MGRVCGLGSVVVGTRGGVEHPACPLEETVRPRDSAFFSPTGWGHLQLWRPCPWDWCGRCPEGKEETYQTFNDLLNCSHRAQQGPAAGKGAGAVSHFDAAAQDALNSASAEEGHYGARGSAKSILCGDTVIPRKCGGMGKFLSIHILDKLLAFVFRGIVFSCN